MKIRTPSDNLHQLIHSLSRGEHQHFRRRASQANGEKKYLLVFDAIAEQSSYNESQILEEFKDESFTRNFSSIKHYLYKVILDSLTESSKDSESELKADLHKIRVLSEKGLFSHTHKLFKSIIAKASKQENFLELANILDLERHVLWLSRGQLENDNRLKEILKEELHVQKLQNNLLNYIHIQDQLLIAGKSGSQSSLKKVIETLTKSELMQDEAKALSVKAKILFWNIQMLVCRIQNEFYKGLKPLNQKIKLFEKHKALLFDQKNLFLYIDTLYNCAHYYLITDQEKIGLKIIQKLKSLKKLSIQAEAKVFEFYYSFKLSLAYKTKSEKLGFECIREISAQLPQYKGKLIKRREQSLYYTIVSLCLILGRCQEGLPWINLILNESEKDSRPEFHHYARLMNLIIHYELENYDLIPHLILSSRRYYKNRNSYDSFEKLFTRYIQKLANKGPRESRQKLWKEFKASLLGLSDQPAHQNAQRYFDFNAWVETKLSH